MRLGFCTSAYPGRPLPELFNQLADAGYGAVEVFTWEGHPCHPDAFDSSTAPSIRDEAARCGIEVSAISAHTTWLEPGPSARAAVEFTNRSALVASHLGVRILSTSTGPYLPQCDHFEAWDAMRAGILNAVAHAESLGITLCIEPHVGHIVMTWESALRLIREVGSPNLRVNFDASHFFLLGLDHRVALQQLAPYVAHVHLKDFILRRPPLAELRLPHSNETAVALGDGDFPLAAHIEQLRQVGYDGVVSAELYVQDPDDAMRRSAANVLPML